MAFIVKGYFLASLSYFNLLNSNFPFNYIMVFLFKLNILQGKLFEFSRHSFIILPGN